MVRNCAITKNTNCAIAQIWGAQLNICLKEKMELRTAALCAIAYSLTLTRYIPFFHRQANSRDECEGVMKRQKDDA